MRGEPGGEAVEAVEEGNTRAGSGGEGGRTEGRGWRKDGASHLGASLEPSVPEDAADAIHPDPPTTPPPP